VRHCRGGSGGTCDAATTSSASSWLIPTSRFARGVPQLELGASPRFGVALPETLRRRQGRDWKPSHSAGVPPTVLPGRSTTNSQPTRRSPPLQHCCGYLWGSRPTTHVPFRVPVPVRTGWPAGPRQLESRRPFHHVPCHGG